MAKTDNWIGAASADWGASAANWSAGFPVAASNVRINTAKVLTVTFSGIDHYTINSLTVGRDFFIMSGGNLTVKTTASFAHGFTQTGGTLTAGGAVTITGSATLAGGAAEGKTTFAVSGTTALGNYTLGGSSVLNNAGTVNETSQINMGDATGINATIRNEKGAAFNIGGDYGIRRSANTARLFNLGGAILEKTGGTETSVIGVSTTDSGAIVVDTGTIEFEGASNSFAGAISGAGEFALGGGSQNLIAKGAKISTATFAISDHGTLVTLGGDLGYAGSFDLLAGAALDLAGFTLTLSGTDALQFSAVDGAGALVTARGGTAEIGNLTLGGDVGWRNFGTVNEVGALTIGDSSAGTAAFLNEKGGAYHLTGDFGVALATPLLASGFYNLAGATLDKTGGTGNSIIAANMFDSGAIVVSIGEIECKGANNVFAGAISGAGQFALGGGSTNLIADGAALTVATFGIYDNGTLVTLGENLSYGHSFNLEETSALDLAGFTLTLSGADTFLSGPVIEGTGILVTAHGSSSLVSDLTPGRRGRLAEFRDCQRSRYVQYVHDRRHRLRCRLLYQRERRRLPLHQRQQHRARRRSGLKLRQSGRRSAGEDRGLRRQPHRGRLHQ